MKQVLLIGLFIAVQTSVFVHIFSLVGYIASRKIAYVYLFIVTSITNICISVAIASMVAINPSVLNGIKLDLIFIIESGLLCVYMLSIKVRLTVIILRRVKDPANYHRSYFGKKIFNKKIVDLKELMTYFLTLPFTLISGAYFVVKLLNY